MRQVRVNPREQAWDQTTMVWERWEQGLTQTETEELVAAAFAADPTWSDTYVIQALFLCQPGSIEQIAAYRAAAAFAERDVLDHRATMGAPKSDVWNMLVARPYFRAWGGLATALTWLGADSEAIGIQTKLLATRAFGMTSDGLAAATLAAGRVEHYRKLRKRSGDEQYWSALNTLAAYLEGDAKAAERGRRELYELNGYLPGLLANGRARDYWPVGMINGMSGEGRALLYAQGDAGAAWGRHPAASAWLVGQGPELRIGR